MHIESLFEERFILAANPSPKAAWAKQWHTLPMTRPCTAAELLPLPFILPEPDASRRRQFDDWCFQATRKTFDVVLETGDWHTILDFAEAGIGVGLVTDGAIESYKQHRQTKFTTRTLDPNEFPPDAIRLIARKAHGRAEPELSELGTAFYRLLIGQKV
jgi:DNA-binding transcriptional LysR family regulator